MRRFAVRPEQIEGNRVMFDRAETRHIAAVLRLVPGDVVVAADGRGRDYTVRIDRLAPAVVGTVLAVGETRAESPLAVTLVQGVPKGERMEMIVRAVTELGVARVLPALTERTVVRLDAAHWLERARRWQRVAREAAKQCGRAVVPEVESPQPLAVRLGTPAEVRVCLWEGTGPALETVLGAVARPRTAAVLVGPEGGLAETEVHEARTAGWAVARLGPRILRTETAGMAILAVLQARWGDLTDAPARG
jgi:16S rRNA (uracil1498-N3)-methyltransferase